MRRRQAILRILSLAAVLTASGAHAAPPEAVAPELKARAQAHLEQARVAYNLGQFEEALRAYEAAYRVVPLPALLFNIAQCHRQRGDCQQALFFFDGYLREANPGAQQRALVDELVSECKASVKAAAAKAATPAPTPPITTKPTPKAAPAPEAAPTPAAAPVRLPPPPPPPAPALAPAVTATGPLPEVSTEAPVYQRWWFWVAIGAGVAAAGAGAAVALSSKGGGAEVPAGSLGTVDWR
jgi:hypothetical protein